MNESSGDTLMQMAQRLEDAAAALETAAVRVLEQQVALAAKAEEALTENNAGETIVATMDSVAEEQRVAELERRLNEAEARLIAFSAAADAATETRRKTKAPGVTTMLAKQEDSVRTFEATSFDSALASLSIEQRIAVKAELLRSGLIG